MDVHTCAIVGSRHIGKTSLIQTYWLGSFSPVFIPGAFDILRVNAHIDDQPRTLNLWSVPDPYINEDMHADVVILAFSIVCPTSYDSIVTQWYPSLARQKEVCPYILVGLKSDLRHDAETLEHLRDKGLKPITRAQGITLAKYIRAVRYLECSALTQQGVSELFSEAVHVIDKYKVLQRTPRNNNNNKYRHIHWHCHIV